MEQRIIYRYHASVRQIENERSVLAKKERVLEDKQNDVFTFKRAFREYINDTNCLQGYPPEIRQHEGTIEEHRYLASFEDGIDALIRLAEQENEAEHEALRTEWKSLQIKEDSETEAYQAELKDLHGGSNT